MLLRYYDAIKSPKFGDHIKSKTMEEKIACENCTLRAKYDAKPKSFAGRFWRWHINFCPGWKKYMLSLDETTKKEISEKYSFRKY